MESPSTKHFSPTGFTVSVSPFPKFFPFYASYNCSSSALFLCFSYSIWIWASLSFFSKTRSLSDLHLLQFHFPLSTTWNLTFPQLSWNHLPDDSHWVPDFKFHRSHYTRLAQCCLQVQDLVLILRSLMPLLVLLETEYWPHIDISSSRSDVPYIWPPWRPRGLGTHPSPVLFRVTTHYPGFSSSLKTVWPLRELTQHWYLT